MKIADRTDARPRRNLMFCDEVGSSRAGGSCGTLAKRWATRRGSTLVGASLVAVAAVAAAGFAVTVVDGTGLSDSGWTSAKPATVLDEHPSNDPAMRIAINHVLELSQAPLLVSPAPVNSIPVAQAPAAQPAPSSAAADGWRRMQILFGSAPDNAAPPEARLGKPIAVEPESECGGPNESSAPATMITQQPANEHSPAKGSAHSSSAAPMSEASDEAVDSASTAALSEPTSLEPETSDAKSAVGAQANGIAPQAITVKRVPLSEEAPPEKRRPELSPLVEPLKAPLPPMTRNMQNLRNKVRTVLKAYYNKPLNSRDNDTWEMMHGMLAYGLDSHLREGGPKGDLITAVGWLCYNKPCKGLTLMYVTPEGELRAKQGAGLQGHMGQLLAMLAQCRVSPDYPIKVGQHDFTVRDLIEVEKKTCYEKTELTFKLIGLMHYLNSDDRWVNDQGMEWDIPKLISEELAQPIRGAACGGTHRLSGLSLAARTRVRRGEPLDGEFAKASEFVERYHNYAFQMQNPDGSLSTEWFRGKGDDDDIDRRVKTTGHILEWLCYSLSDDQMRSNRVFAATNYLASLLYTNSDHEWEKGPIGHAIHALRLYDERMLQPYDNAENVASDASANNTPNRSKSRSQQR
jgi:hypothetical protein